MDNAALRKAGLVVFTVGQPYNPNLPLPMDERPDLLITGDQIMLTVSYADPTSEEIHQFRQGKVRFAWIDSEHAAVFAFKLGDLPWADSSFHPQMVISAGYPAPKLPPDQSRPVMMVMVDATTGIVVGIRLLGLPQRFVQAMATTISRMQLTPYSDAAHDAALDALYSRYPTSAKLVRDRADVTCIGAEPESTLPGAGADAN